MKNRRDYPNQEIRGEEKSTLSGEGFIQDSLFEKIPFGENPGMGFLKTEASAAIRNAQWEKARIPKQWKWWKKKLVTLNSSGALQARLNDCDSTSATEVRKQQTKHRSWKPLWNRHWWLCMSRWANSTQIRDPELSEVGVRFNRAKIFYRSDSTRSMESMKTSIVTSWWSFECWMLLKSSVKF